MLQRSSRPNSPFRYNAMQISRIEKSSGGANARLHKITFFAVACVSVLLFTTIATLHKSLLSIVSENNGHPLSPLAKALEKAPVGSLGPPGTRRTHYRYYDSLFHAALQFGANATSAIEVGCAADPFIKNLEWVDRKTCVAPYFVEYGKRRGKDLKKESGQKIEAVTADFMEYQLPNNQKYDLLLCSQVLEHVPNPAAFMKKLIGTATTSIISVPYQWRSCGDCHHVTDRISYEKLLQWSAPHEPIYSGIVTEKNFVKRIMVVYKME